MRKSALLFSLLLTISALLSGCEISVYNGSEHTQTQTSQPTTSIFSSDSPADTSDPQAIPEYSGEPYTVLNDNVPYFTDDEITAEAYELYSELDSLGRCGVAMACIGKELMPSEERESIGQVRPTGWQTVKYDCVDGKYLYNRCHLIGFQLTGENANKRNLITGTRYLNVEGMLPFENMAADYIKETSNHVMYRVTPVFTDENLVADGVIIEAYSVEDKGDGICFNVYVYNVQPGVTINYATGESKEAESSEGSTQDITYVLNTSSDKFHTADCPSISKISKENKDTFTGTKDELISMGYSPCGQCKP